MLRSNKQSKLMKLLKIDDGYVASRGLHLNEPDENDQEDLFVDKTDKIFIEKKKDQKKKKPTDLRVKSVIKEEDDYETIHPFLPKIPFSLLNCGTRGAGKTVLCLNILEWYKGHFDEIFIFSPTIELDYKYKLMFEKLDMEFEFGKNIFVDYNENVLQKIMLKIKRFNKNKPFKDKAKILFIFDDIVSSIPKNKRRTIFNKLILNNRHYNASVIINSQTFKLLDSNFRKVSSQIVLFKTDNVIELYAYAQELSAILGRTRHDCINNFLKYYDVATQDPHSFLYINYHHPAKFFKNMNQAIVMNGEIAELQNEDNEFEVKKEVEQLDEDVEEIKEEIVDTPVKEKTE